MLAFESNEGNGNVRALAQRDFILRWGRRFLFAAIVVALGFGGFHGYGAWRKQHLVRQTEDFVARGEYQSAVLVARRLLQLDANNLAACRAMAAMAEKAGKADALTWRQKIAHLTPGVVENQLALARTALHFAQPDLAETVLNALPESARQTVEYHQIAGGAALLQQQPARAENHFAKALQIAPDNPRLALSLAVLHLANNATVKEARATLVKLREEPSVRVEALRALAADAVAHQDRVNGAKWALELNAEKDASFADALLKFEALEGTETAAAALEALRVRAEASPETTAELITWLNRHGLAQVALAWASSLPKGSLQTQPIPLALAESYSFLQDWTSLRDFVRGKDWGELEAMRLAVESHALHRLSPPDRPSMETQTLWRAALKASAAHPDQLVGMARLAEGWGYKSEAEEAWWTIATSHNNPRPALSALQRFYQAQKDTRGLLRVARRALELNPDDLVAANNCASLGLLLNGDSTARRLASKLHREHPGNRAFAATYAFALHTEGKFAEGLQVMESLKEAELRHPAIAAYYVVLLVESGRMEQARAYLANAKSAVLLPEEQQLLSAATRKLAATG